MMKLYWIAVATVAAVAVPTLVSKTNYVTEYTQPNVPIVKPVSPVIKPIIVNQGEVKSVTTLSLSSKRSVTIYDEIREDAAQTAAKITELAVKSKDPIYLLINSPGGSVMDGALILSAMQASQAPVYTVCLSLCASMAAIIFSYGTERYMVDRSILMFHEAAGAMQGYLNHMTSRVTMLNDYVGKMDQYIASRAGVPYEEFRKSTSNELWMDADESVKRHYADKIVQVNLSTDNGLLNGLGSKNVWDKFKIRVRN